MELLFCTFDGYTLDRADITVHFSCSLFNHQTRSNFIVRNSMMVSLHMECCCTSTVQNLNEQCVEHTVPSIRDIDFSICCIIVYESSATRRNTAQSFVLFQSINSPTKNEIQCSATVTTCPLII